MLLISAMAENDVTPKYTAEQLAGDEVSKKELCGYLQEVASFQVGELMISTN
jgi:hypothetical protein